MGNQFNSLKCLAIDIVFLNKYLWNIWKLKIQKYLLKIFTEHRMS